MLHSPTKTELDSGLLIGGHAKQKQEQTLSKPLKSLKWRDFQSNSEPGEADSTATGSKIKERLSRGGSAPLQVDLEDGYDEEVKEVAAQPKTAEELANLKIIFHRTPEGVRGKCRCQGEEQVRDCILAQANVPQPVLGGYEEQETGTERWQLLSFSILFFNQANCSASQSFGTSQVINWG